MATNLVNDFLRDLKVEAIKLNFQLASPHSEFQKNEVLGTVIAHEIDSVYVMEVIRAAISDLEACRTIVELHELFDEWNTIRLDIQYNKGYGYDKKTISVRKGQAYAYIFLMRVLKKRHKDLYSYMKLSDK